MMMPFSSKRIGANTPSSSIEAAMRSICSGGWFFGFLSYGLIFSIGQSSTLLAGQSSGARGVFFSISDLAACARAQLRRRHRFDPGQLVEVLTAHVTSEVDGAFRPDRAHPSVPTES